jgi:hypothetical protein
MVVKVVLSQKKVLTGRYLQNLESTATAQENASAEASGLVCQNHHHSGVPITNAVSSPSGT